MTSSPHRTVPASERRPGPGGPLLGAVGTVAVWLATLLPWARSGQVERNLFSVGAIAGRLGFLDALPTGALAAIFLITALPAVLVLFRMWRTAAVLAGAVGALAAVGGAAALAAGPRRGTVVLEPAGPAVLLVAGLILLAAATITIRSTRRSPQISAGDMSSTAR